MQCPCYKKTLCIPRWSRWVVASIFPVLDRRMPCNAKKTKVSIPCPSVAVCSGGEKVRKREPACSAETSKQSKPQIPLFINTQREADVYPGQSREKKLAKAREIHAPQTRDFLGEGVAGNGFCKFFLLITTSQTKSKETFSSYRNLI